MWGLAGAERRTCWCFKVLLNDLLNGLFEGDEASILGAFFFFLDGTLKSYDGLKKS